MNYTHLFACLLFIISTNIFAQKAGFRNESLSIDARLKNLVESLDTEEKIMLLGYRNKSIDRLGIPAYNWWNEGLHGVARAGKATVFPQAIGMAASFNVPLIHKVATAISTEARAKHNLAVARDIRLQYTGLTYWSPNINIFRDPRWGRGQETYGEDPFLTGQMGLAFVKGLQGNHPKYQKIAACAKHYAVHSGPESERHSFDAIIDKKDLRETYLPAFEKLVRGGVESVMGAYNRVNGEPATISPTLMNILRKEWGFTGHFVTDCWALQDIYLTHKVLKTSVEVAAAAINAGVNLDCSDLVQNDLLAALKSNLITQGRIDSALTVLLRTQFKLGFYDNQANNPFSKYGEDSIRSSAHIQLARQLAVESMVLLKNNNNLLPLSPDKLRQVTIQGTNAFSAEALLANYNGVSPDLVTYTEGIIKALPTSTLINYAMGASLTDTSKFGLFWTPDDAMDVNIVVLGLSSALEGEEGDAFLSKDGADKKDLRLPIAQINYLKKLRGHTKKPIVLVLTGGSAMDVKEVEKYADAIVLAWYGGEQGGNALADILFGKVSPSGRLPITFYQSTNDLPDYNNYSMKNRTYRYFTGKPQYPFGFGLSYTNFNYQWQTKPAKKYQTQDSIRFSVRVNNTGNMAAAEVVQAYIQYPNLARMPIKELKAFGKIMIDKQKNATLKLSIAVKDLQKWDLAKDKYMVYKGNYKLVVGGSSDDAKLVHLFDIK